MLFKKDNIANIHLGCNSNQYMNKNKYNDTGIYMYSPSVAFGMKIIFNIHESFNDRIVVADPQFPATKAGFLMYLEVLLLNQQFCHYLTSPCSTSHMAS